jgi:hypothetical protein
MFIKLQDGKAVKVVDASEITKTDKWMHTCDIQDEQEAIEIAQQLTEATGTLYIHSVNESWSPKFSVVEPPKIGDLVSGKFNGDSNPCGVVVKVSKTFRIVTSTGHKFNRVKQTSCWSEVNGYRNLIQGHHNERNAEF